MDTIEDIEAEVAEAIEAELADEVPGEDVQVVVETADDFPDPEPVNVAPEPEPKSDVIHVGQTLLVDGEPVKVKYLTGSNYCRLVDGRAAVPEGTPHRGNVVEYVIA